MSTNPPIQEAASSNVIYTGSSLAGVSKLRRDEPISMKNFVEEEENYEAAPMQLLQTAFMLIL